MPPNPRRTTPMSLRRDVVDGPEVLSLKTTAPLRKGVTFHSPVSSSPTPPPIRRVNSNFDHVVDAHRRRVALTLSNIDQSLAASDKDSSSSTASQSLRDDSLPIPQGFLDHTVMPDHASQGEADRRILRPRQARRRSSSNNSNATNNHDSGIGSSIVTSTHKRAADAASRKDAKKSSVGALAITSSAAGSSSAAEGLPGLSGRAIGRIHEHIIKPLLADPSLKDFRPIAEECPGRIRARKIVCLRDLEKTLLYLAPTTAKTIGQYRRFCLTSIRCIQATVEYLTDREQTRPHDRPYTSGYFVDLVEQINQHAAQLAAARDRRASGQEPDEMDADPTDQIKLRGGLGVNGRPAELVRVKKSGKAVSMATGQPVESEDEGADAAVRFKRSLSQRLEDEEEIMRSMARRKKNPTPEELAPKKCREPGCNKEFKRPCDLTKHEKTHSRPWKCPVVTCKYHEYGWPTEKEMDRHHNDKHSSAPAMFECLFAPCPYRSKRESNCKQHMEKAHGWEYVRTKHNGKKPAGKPEAASKPTPITPSLPTPSSEQITTPPLYPDAFDPTTLIFPTYQPDHVFNAQYPPQPPVIDEVPDLSPVDGSPSSEYGQGSYSIVPQELADFGVAEDIYGATVQLPPTPSHDLLEKGAAETLFSGVSAAIHDYTAPMQLEPHISPIGQGNAMLFTPSSLAEVDEGLGGEKFDDLDTFGDDFQLFDPVVAPKAAPGGGGGFNDGLFGEIPSAAAGYTQPSSQDFNLEVHMDWSPDYGFVGHN